MGLILLSHLVPPTVECITATEEICQKLAKGEAEELRAEVKNILKKAHPPKPNITKEELKAIEKLRKDDTRIVLTGRQRGGLGSYEERRI